MKFRYDKLYPQKQKLPSKIYLWWEQLELLGVGRDIRVQERRLAAPGQEVPVLAADAVRQVALEVQLQGDLA